MIYLLNDLNTVFSPSVAYRDAYFHDLAECCKKENSWVIVIKQHLKSSSAPEDFYLTCTKADGSPLLMSDMKRYKDVCQLFTNLMAEEDEPLAVDTTGKYFSYALKDRYSIKRMTEDCGVKCNSFVIRPSAEVMNQNERKLIIAYRIAQLLSQQLDNSRGMQPDDLADLQKPGYGYTETGHKGTKIDFEEDRKNPKTDSKK